MSIRQELKYKEFLKFEELRCDSDLKQSDIANVLKVKRNTYSKWENCINDIPLDICNELANYYNVDLDYIVGLTTNRQKDSNSNKINWQTLTIRLRELRQENNITQSVLSDKVGFVTATYAKYEEGINKPTTIKLLALAMFYNVSMDYLVGRKDKRKIIEEE